MGNRDFVVRFAGEGGGGLVTSAELLAQVTAQVGYHVKTYVTFPSQIMGGPHIRPGPDLNLARLELRR